MDESLCDTFELHASSHVLRRSDEHIICTYITYTYIHVYAHTYTVYIHKNIKAHTFIYYTFLHTNNTYIHTYTHTYINTCTFICIRTYKHTNDRTQISAYMYWTHAQTHTNTNKSTHTCTYIHIRSYIHTYTYTYTYRESTIIQ